MRVECSLSPYENGSDDCTNQIFRIVTERRKGSGQWAPQPLLCLSDDGKILTRMFRWNAFSLIFTNICLSVDQQNKKRITVKNQLIDYALCNFLRQFSCVEAKADRAPQWEQSLGKVPLQKELDVDTWGPDILKCSRGHMWFPVQIPTDCFWILSWP